ncbi:MAG: hypothetical protein CL666_08865 [Balneola sp.]|nr:hypothetical protein [Balneola sp.]
MNSSMWWILSMVFLLIPLQVHAQSRTLSIEEAVALFEQNSLQQELAKLEELRRQGEAQQYKAYANPEVIIYSEQLNIGTLDYDETTYQISQPIELLGQPFLRNKSANKSSEAARLAYQYDRSVLIQQVKNLYTEYWYLQRKLEVYGQAIDVIDQVLRSAKDRQIEGTTSGIQVQRFTVEKNRYLRMRNVVELEMMQAQKQLAAMITSSQESDFEFEVESPMPVEPLMEDEEMLRLYALQHRVDLQAMEMQSEALGLKYKVEKRERLPDLNVSFGYKNQSDGSEGFVIGGGIKLPIFNRNSGNITMAEAEQRTVETSLHIQRRTIQNQVEIAYMRVQNLYAQWEDMQQNPLSSQMLETARASYQEGQYSLVELLDATKAYVDGLSFHYRITADYHQALFQLDTITSGKIFSTQTNSEQ